LGKTAVSTSGDNLTWTELKRRAAVGTTNLLNYRHDL